MPVSGPLLRDVLPTDIPVFFEHQADPEATTMADFPARDRAAFDAHWERVLAGPGVAKTIVFEGQVAGNVLSWVQDGRRLVGYWLGKEFWGKGLATQALRELIDELDTRPLHAYVAKTNIGSIRVLEKCGFVRSDEDEHEDLYTLS
jgi:RimJ/RimL family protein N-acetyltransferase